MILAICTAYVVIAFFYMLFLAETNEEVTVGKLLLWPLILICNIIVEAKKIIFKFGEDISDV